MYKFIAIDIREYPDPLLASFFHDGSNGVKLVSGDKVVPLPEITILQRMQVGVIAARSLGPESQKWLEWADMWLGGKEYPFSIVEIINEAAWWANENASLGNEAAFAAVYAVSCRGLESIVHWTGIATKSVTSWELLNIIKQVINDRD